MQITYNNIILKIRYYKKTLLFQQTIDLQAGTLKQFLYKPQPVTSLTVKGVGSVQSLVMSQYMPNSVTEVTSHMLSRDSIPSTDRNSLCTTSRPALGLTQIPHKFVLEPSLREQNGHSAKQNIHLYAMPMLRMPLRTHKLRA